MGRRTRENPWGTCDLCGARRTIHECETRGYGYDDLCGRCKARLDLRELRRRCSRGGTR